MFNSSALEIAVGLTVSYLGISLMCTAVNELLAAFTRARAMELERGIRNLLDGNTRLPERLSARACRAFMGASVPRPGGWSEAFFSHPLISVLSKVDQKPSYIPAQLFARALLNVAAQKAKDSGKPGSPSPVEMTGSVSFDQIRETLEMLPNDCVRRALIPLLNEASTDLTAGVSAAKKFLDQVETWYDHAMERVSGWYKRRTQYVLILIATILVFALNVDTVAICRALGRDEALRRSLVSAAEEVARHPPRPAAPPGAPSSATDAIAAVQDRARGFNQLGIPLGWTRWEDAHASGSSYAPRDDNLYDVSHDAGLSFTKLLGLLATAFAASLGAPFWFDALNKIMSVRASGKAPEERPKDPRVVLQPSSPKQTP